ncbi:MAG: histidine kinase [Bacteroidota bacterium]
MREKILAYSKELIKPFFIGAVVLAAVDYLLLGWPMGVNMAWRALYSGLLTAFLWVGNGAIAEEIKISWIERPVRRLVLTSIWTVIVTVFVVVFVDIIVTLLRQGVLPNLKPYTDVDTYFSTLIITLVISLFMHGRQFLINYRDSIIAQEELKRTSLASRYESLQNQINPHFLFNSLNVLSTLIRKDVDLSDKFIEQLAAVYRYVLESRNQEVVSLSKEKEMLEAYLFLLQIRFGEQLQVDIDLPEGTGEVIPPLTLQLLAENAVKHNVVSRKRPLSLSISRAGEEILVRNTLQPKQQKQESLGIGLNNIRERYLLLSEKEIQVGESEGQFEVRLPVLQMHTA